MRAVIVDDRSASGIALGQREQPVPGEHEALVRVAAVSLNPGELRRSALARPDWRPGRDFAGIIEQAAGDGSGPPPGSRVVGWVNGGAFAEFVAAPTDGLATLPRTVSFEDAATLPVAGMTALFALERFGSLLGRRVLVTGASGGVGQFGIQLARAAGARATAALRDPARAKTVEALGAHDVVVGAELAERRSAYDVVLDTVGADTLPSALAALRPGGICVAVGSMGRSQMTLDFASFLMNGQRMESFYLFDELLRRRADEALTRLSSLVADGRLRPHIGLQAPWTDIESLAAKLLDRGVTGKVVLQVKS